jgi:hypothetical protein
MYRAGTGDFFVLKFFAGTRHTFTMMIDCGCINGSRETFAPLLEDLVTFTKKGQSSTIDLLVVTHQHDDHINGFKKAADTFRKIHFKKVWFAWTEDSEDPQATNLRRTEGRIKLALYQAANQLEKLIDDPAYQARFHDIHYGNLMYKGQQHFMEALMELTEVNSIGLRETETVSPLLKANKTKAASEGLNLAATDVPTMRDLLEEWNIIKADTIVEYLEPGDLIDNLQGAIGLRFFILGPPRQTEYIFMEDREDEVFDKRKKPSAADFSFLSLFMSAAKGSSLSEPFADHFTLQNEKDEVVERYNANEWQKIDMTGCSAPAA